MSNPNVDLTTPQARIAQFFMRDTKGLDIRPHAVEELEAEPCWYFYYEVNGSELELEVFFDEKLDDWTTTVTCIRPLAQ